MLKRTIGLGLSTALLALLSISASACIGLAEEEYAEETGGEYAEETGEAEPATLGLTEEKYAEDTGRAEPAAVYVAAVAGAQAVFDSYGETMTVTDTQADGYGAVSEIAGWNHFCWAQGGAGSRASCNYDLPEGIWIQFRACIAHRGYPFAACSAWVTASTSN